MTQTGKTGTRAADVRRRAAIRYERIMRSSARCEAIYRGMLEYVAGDPAIVELLKEAHRQRLEYIARLAEKAGVARGKTQEAGRATSGARGWNGRGTGAR